MPERGGDGRDSGRAEDDPADGGYGPGEQLRRALAQQRHAEEARRFFEAAPLYRVTAEGNGTWSLGEKRYDYWPALPPASSTRWRVLSNHSDLEHAERRLRHITSPHIHYDEHGRLAKTPREG